MTRNMSSKIRLAVILFVLASVGVTYSEAGQGCPFDDGSCQEYCATQGCHVGYCGHFAWIQCICRKCGKEWTWYDEMRSKAEAANATTHSALTNNPSAQASSESSGSQSTTSGNDTKIINDESTEKMLMDILKSAQKQQQQQQEEALEQLDANRQQQPQQEDQLESSGKANIIFGPETQTQYVIATGTGKDDKSDRSVLIKTPTRGGNMDEQLDIVNDIIMRLRPAIMSTVNGFGRDSPSRAQLPVQSTTSSSIETTAATTASTRTPIVDKSTNGSGTQDTNDEDNKLTVTSNAPVDSMDDDDDYNN